MPTVMLGTCQENWNRNFARLAAAADAKAAGGTVTPSVPPGPGYTATLGLAYSAIEDFDRNWDLFDQAISTGATTARLRFVGDEAVNTNLRRLVATLAGCTPPITIPLPL